MSTHPLDCQAYVLKAGEDVSKPAVYNESVENVRSWVLNETTPKNQDDYIIYMGENRTYMSIPQFLGLTKRTPTKIVDLQKSIDRGDSVNHPSHYNAYKGLEIIQLTEQMNFNKGNAVKYIARAGLKNPATEIEDLKKAAWYINREIQRLGLAAEETLYKDLSEKMQEYTKEVVDPIARKVGSFDANSSVISTPMKFSLYDFPQFDKVVERARKMEKHGIAVEKKDAKVLIWIHRGVPYGEIWEIVA
jgi:hypothetical protein